jgi:hypothetical protein
LSLYAYCGNDPVMYRQGSTLGGSIAVLSMCVGDSYGGSFGGSSISGGNPSIPEWLQTLVGAIPDIWLGIKYLNAKGIHTKFAYATKTRYMRPIMDSTWRWIRKTSSNWTNFASLSQGAFKQILTGDAKAGFGALAKSFGSTVGLNAFVNFGFNYYENNWKIDGAMLKDTAIDTAIGVGSYYLATGTMSLVTTGAVMAGFAVPGIIVVVGVVLLSIGFELLIREITGYYD